MAKYDTNENGELDWLEFATMFAENLEQFKARTLART